MNLYKELGDILRPAAKVSTVNKETIAGIYRNQHQLWKDSIYETLERMLNLLPSSRFERLISKLRYTSINLVDDNDLVIYIEGITKTSVGWSFELASSRGNRMKHLSDITTESQLEILEALENIVND